MDFIIAHLVQILAVVGLILLAVEVLVLGASTFVLLLMGMGLLLASLSMYLEWIPATWQWALVATTFYTLVSGGVLWPIFKRAQQKPEHTNVNSDLIGHSFVLPQDTTPETPTSYRFSGIEWRLIAQEPLTKGTLVEVIHLQVGELFIRAKQ
ncbi:NfeD family protein [Vibrio rhizosphaerae]|uniref:NfeD family protein n=2 Tax=Vibrio rhizosphaerae TaxID=398736 RepID=A0ABU4IYV1_9VIBR|nr:NfeD family protein [Vibrio rhizosphaerae]MDW6094317.1 NfeD family protein [Vibrio rhizosphaerae]